MFPLQSIFKSRAWKVAAGGFSRSTGFSAVLTGEVREKASVIKPGILSEEFGHSARIEDNHKLPGISQCYGEDVWICLCWQKRGKLFYGDQGL